MTNTVNSEPDQAPYEPEHPPRVEQATTLSGVDYRVWRWGEPGGRPVVLLHGWMDSGATFQFLVDRLPAGWDIIAPDWRGFGDSGRAPEHYYFPDYLADLDALVNHYFRDRPILLIGHSMGGNVAGLYAGVRPDRVEHLVSIEGFGLAESDPDSAPRRYAEWLDSLRETPSLRSFDSFSALSSHLRRQNPRLNAERAAFVARCWGRTNKDGTVVLRGDPRHKRPNPVLYRLDEAKACWRRITAPVLWVVGAESGIVERLGMTRDFEARLSCFRDIRTETVPGAGHAVHQDQPDHLARLVVPFAS